MAFVEAFLADPSSMDEFVARLSDRVAARILEAMKAEEMTLNTICTETWLDARQVARRLGVSREWVYEHADELGASRIGGGRRPRLRFPAHAMEFGHDRRTDSREANPPDPPRGRTSGLIPIHKD